MRFWPRRVKGLNDKELRDAVMAQFHEEDESLPGYTLRGSYSSTLGNKTAIRDYEITDPDGNTHIFREFSDVGIVYGGRKK